MSNSTLPSPYPLSTTGASALGGKKIAMLVIGSGYGGAIAAYRMAGPSRDVYVFERGREILPRAWGGPLPDSFPDTLAMVQGELNVDTDSKQLGNSSGLFNLHVGKDVSVLVGCGLGGTSLINANVALEADRRVFEKGWPATFQTKKTLDDLDKAYATARSRLGSTPYPWPKTFDQDSPYPALHKVRALEVAAKQTGHPFELPPINVTFESGKNFAGVQQQACVLCGDCVTGCNYGSKNTTLMNYLPAAKAKGAKIFTLAEVISIEPLSGGWKVYAVDTSTNPAKPFTVSASMVVLAAGTLGSTEILLRSSKKVVLSDKLGQRFSANGDAFSVGYDTDWNENGSTPALLPGAVVREPIYGIGAGSRLDSTTTSTIPKDPPLRPGPCIAGLIDLREHSTVNKGLVIEEGVVPGAFAAVVPALAFAADAMEGNFFEYADTRLRLQDAQALGTAVRDDAANLADQAYRGPVSRMQSYLVMSHDDAAGRMALENDRLRVEWPRAGKEKTFRRDDRILRQVNGALRGTFLPDPLWSEELGRQLVTVHPLGGCPMGDDALTGVVNDKGQVFNTKTGASVYPTLYVCDGSIIPTSLGVNPLLTIAALAERICDLMVVEHGDLEGDAGSDAATELAPEENESHQERESLLGRIEHAAEHVLETVEKDAGTAVEHIESALGLERDMMIAKIMGDLTGANAFTDAASAEVKAAVADLQATLGTVDPSVVASLTTSATTFVTAEVKAAIVEPLVDAAIAWMATPGDPELTAAFSSQCTKLVERFPKIFSPQFSFAERMSGYVSEQKLAHETPDRTTIENPYEVASRYGEATGSSCLLVADLQVSAASLDSLTSGAKHEASITGKLSLDAFGKNPVNVSGTLALLVPDKERVETWQMIYKLQSAALDIELDGVKILHKQAGSSAWADLTTLFVTLKQQGKPDRRGILRLGVEDLVAQAFSMTPTSNSFVSGLAYIPAAQQQELNLLFVARFAGFFAETVFRAYGGLLADLSNFPAADDKVRKRRALVAPTPELFPFRTPNGSELQLTRYRPAGDTLKPVILAPGFMTSAASFAADTVGTNVVEYLFAQGYDVWLFDYSGSPALSATQPFSLDDVARYDWPTAVDLVCEIAATAKVQVIGHCVGSLSFMMAMLRSDAAPFCAKIQSAICSQLTVHPITDLLNYLKIDLDVLGLLEKVAGVDQIDLRSTPTAASEMLDTMLWGVPVPAGEECNNPLCHRVFSVFGPSYAHAQLNSDTHNALCEWFGTAYADPLRQLTRILRKGHVVDRHGRDTYLPNVKNLAAVPLTFLAGELNQIFAPLGSAITLEWLRKANPASAGLYRRQVFEGYAHMDHFIGKNASTDIFPFLAAALAKPTGES